MIRILNCPAARQNVSPQCAGYPGPPMGGKFQGGRCVGRSHLPEFFIFEKVKSNDRSFLM